MRLRAMRGVNEQLVTLQKLLDGCDAAAKFGAELMSGQPAANHLPTGEALLQTSSTHVDDVVPTNTRRPLSLATC